MEKTEADVRKLYMSAAPCSLDLGDGSERGEYVNQDYILRKLGRPHRAISLMYCYYPYDKEWPQRISEAWKDRQVSFAWDYPYDDYFPYGGGRGGDTQGEPFASMRDVRRHGQDVALTLTMDPNLTDEDLIAVANDLRPFGRMLLRINHEADGNWFSFNKRATYGQVGAFFVRACNIIHEHAPNVKVILCIDGIETLGDEHIKQEEAFAPAVRAADCWSTDKYPALHWGWPYDVAEPGGTTQKRESVRGNYELIRATAKRFAELNNGAAKPMYVNEMNADGDVTGPYDQAAMVKEFADILSREKPEWFDGFTLYQFRDRGRLGLEIEDPNNPDVGIEQPVMATYRKILHSRYFSPVIRAKGAATLPVTLRWGGSEDAEGLGMTVHFEGNPHFCEAVFREDSNLMLELNGTWFYKAPGTKRVDLMSAFFEKPLKKPTDLCLKIFAPPASGENDLSLPDGLVNSYTTIETLPELRILYGPVMPAIVSSDSF